MNDKGGCVQISVFDILEDKTNKLSKRHMTGATIVICLVVMDVNI